MPPVRRLNGRLGLRRLERTPPAHDEAGVSYDYLDFGEEPFPDAIDLYTYRAVVIFTGDNNSFNFSGFFPADQDALAQWLDSGGRLWMTGQNIAETSDSNTFTSRQHGTGPAVSRVPGSAVRQRKRLPGRRAQADRRWSRHHGGHPARPRAER